MERNFRVITVATMVTAANTYRYGVIELDIARDFDIFDLFNRNLLEDVISILILTFLLWLVIKDIASMYRSLHKRVISQFTDEDTFRSLEDAPRDNNNYYE